MRYDYGYRERGLSFEYTNFYGSLCEIADTVLFDFKSIYNRYGKRKMNDMLLREVEKEDPDLVFFFFFTEEFSPAAVLNLSENSRAITFNWFADDHWRFHYYSRYWAPRFNFCSTTDDDAFARYQKLGYTNIIKTQWGANDKVYRKLDIEKDTDVSFVGQTHSERMSVVKHLAQKGIRIECFGNGWPNGRVSQEEMIKVFNRSRINLNFTSSSVGPSKQIKGRTFEVPACNGFLLTEYAPAIERYYDIGKEIDVFHDNDELAEKISYYLTHDKERDAMAEAAYRRTLKEHTYRQRFKEIFSEVVKKV